MLCVSLNQFHSDENPNNGVSLQQNEPFSFLKMIEKVLKNIGNEDIEVENILRRSQKDQFKPPTERNLPAVS